MASSSPAAQRRKGDDHRKGLPGTKATLPLSRRVWFYLGVLTLQYGAQPLLSKRFTGYPPFSRSSSFVPPTAVIWLISLRGFWRIALLTDVDNPIPLLKGLLGVKLMDFGTWFRREVIVTSSVIVCEIAKVMCAVLLLAREAIYALQNSLLQISYKNLDSLTFSMLNQTKLLFTAFFTYLILGLYTAVHIFKNLQKDLHFPSSSSFKNALVPLFPDPP
ncbi:hypothetical protein Taro_023175 [Colocasia esculenta]|uniref:Uncharacterized protein n=1 Tax=Colocasia esculenta TaxID=4460 RepID=A0A843VA39_COLES|nr:hypothetical protein [Colocasia esculenta]